MRQRNCRVTGLLRARGQVESTSIRPRVEPNALPERSRERSRVAVPDLRRDRLHCHVAGPGNSPLHAAVQVHQQAPAQLPVLKRV